jgi:malate dehydrogenase
MSFRSLLLISLFFLSQSLEKATKVTVVGAGNVGATAANYLALNEVASEIVLIDIKEGLAEGKAMDIMQTSEILGFSSIVTGVTNDYTLTENSDVVVITSGVPRKPGMTREELLGVNAGIVKNVVDNLIKYSPEAIFVVVANPMDVMTKLTLKLTGLPKNRVIGMGGLLDSNRFKYFLADALGCNYNDVQGLVIGGHGDKTMVPLARYATYKGVPVSDLLPQAKIEEVVKSTMLGGATLTKLLGTSAWIAPGASIAYLVDSIINDKKRLITCSVYLEGEYGWKDITIGVPIIVGKTGVEKIVTMELNEEEQALFDASAKSVKENEDMLDDLEIFG